MRTCGPAATTLSHFQPLQFVVKELQAPSLASVQLMLMVHNELQRVDVSRRNKQSVSALERVTTRSHFRVPTSLRLVPLADSRFSRSSRVSPTFSSRSEEHGSVRDFQPSTQRTVPLPVGRPGVAWCHWCRLVSPGVTWCHLVSPSDFGLRSSVLVVSENPEKSHNWQTTNFRAGRGKSGPDDPTGLEHLGGKEGRMEGRME